MQKASFRLFGNRWARKIGLALSVSALVLVITQDEILRLGIIQRLELASIDYRFAYRGIRRAARDSSQVVIVEISEESFKTLPRQWPWPRSYYAHLIRNLHRAGAKVVGLDLILSGEDVYSPDNDAALRSAITETGIVVLAGKSEVVNELYLHTYPSEDYGNIFFPVDSALGLVNIRNDADGILRRYSPFFGTNSGRLIPTFSFALLNKYYGLPPLTLSGNAQEEFLYLDRSLPKYDPTSVLINFYGPNRTFPHYQFADVLDDETIETNEEIRTGDQINTFSDPDFGYLYDGTFRDKVVLVGSTVPEAHDLFPVSIARGREEGDNLMYGVEIHANVIESILRNEPIHSQSKAKEILTIIMLTLVTFVVTSALKESKTRHHFLVELNVFLFCLAEIVLIGTAAMVLFIYYHSYLMTVIGPMVAVLGGYVASTTYHFVVERKQRMLIKTMFSTYVNPSFVEELILHPEKLTLGGERKELTVLFSDIEGFTTISERISPEELVGVLNEYLSVMSDLIFQNDGTLDKYEGDAVMAFWGAPIPQEDHALRACMTALQMQDALAGLRSEWHARGKPPFHARIGISTGEMIVGNMGGRGKFDYTVIGDSVNLGDRLEGANKQYKTKIVVSQRTYDLVRNDILGRELDLITVQGRSEPLRIYELIQVLQREIDPALQVFLVSYAEALHLYRQRCWSEAVKGFESALTLRASDFPSKMYRERAIIYGQNPPPDDWNGVFQMVSK